jgi:hypothetical protein
MRKICCMLVVGIAIITISIIGQIVLMVIEGPYPYSEVLEDVGDSLPISPIFGSPLPEEFIRPLFERRPETSQS